MGEQVTFPQNPTEWRAEIAKQIGLSETEAIRLYQANEFPYRELITWFERDYGVDQGYAPEFIPALTRNIKGLVNWVYGDGDEPYWQGSDFI